MVTPLALASSVSAAPPEALWAPSGPLLRKPLVGVGQVDSLDHGIEPRRYWLRERAQGFPWQPSGPDSKLPVRGAGSILVREQIPTWSGQGRSMAKNLKINK